MTSVIEAEPFTGATITAQDADMEWRERITEARRRAGLTQEALAKRAGFGQSTIGRWEVGPGKPTIEQFAQLAEAMGLTVSELYGDSDAEPVSRPTAEERAILAVIRGHGLDLEEAVRRLSGVPAYPTGQPVSPGTEATIPNLPHRRRSG